MQNMYINEKEYLGVSIIITILFFMAFLMPSVVSAEELENFKTSDLNEEIVLEENKENVSEEPKATEEVNNEEVADDSNKEETVTENKREVSNDDNKDKSKTSNTSEVHKVLCIITKVDEDGNPLKGAVLQIIDSNGNVVDEWTSDGTKHETYLPEGEYTLHEKSAPEGYKLADDQSFTVKVEIASIDAGVDYSEVPCQHYGGTPLYYVEIEGEKYEVYCINQDWETPDDYSIYDGAVLTSSDINTYTTQTVYTDAHQNKGSVDISDQSLSSEELYNKLLTIIYHRQLASSIFTDLTEAEIRYVTESALKNYTNAGLTRVQRVATTAVPTGYDRYDYYVDGRFTWYLYPWYRSFIYDPDAPLGSNVYKTDIGNGNAFGTLARHWNDGHYGKSDPDARAKLARFYELYLYLISDDNPHPSDMHLYIFTTTNKALDLSGYDFDEGAYQNLLGIRWYNPQDEDHKIYLSVVNEKAPVEKKKVKKTKKHKQYKKSINPQTGDSIMNYIIMLPISLYGMVGGSVYLRTRKEN